jgi:hypothetical protein
MEVNNIGNSTNVNNMINLTFFDHKERVYSYTVLIILNRPILKEMFLQLKDKVNHIICADGAANRMYDDLGINK